MSVSRICIVFVAAACSKAPSNTSIDAATASDSNGVVSDAPTDPYRAIFDAVDPTKLVEVIKDMTGYNEVTIDNRTFRITDRYSIEGKANFRAYFRHYFETLGLAVNTIDYTTQHYLPGETQGHDLEAVMPGESADSVVIVVHYDSRGPIFQETTNPAVDDDMTGMASMLETARLLALRPGKRHYTVRFAAVDFEEWPWPDLEGSAQYVTYLNALATHDGFAIVSAINDEQSGWNCHAHNKCSEVTADTFDIVSTSTDGTFNYPSLGQSAVGIAQTYSDLVITQPTSPTDDSDHYSFWRAGMPTVQISEHNPGDNPHFDVTGGDTLDKLDTEYYVKLARVVVTFSAKMVIIAP